MGDDLLGISPYWTALLVVYLFIAERTDLFPILGAILDILSKEKRGNFTRILWCIKTKNGRISRLPLDSLAMLVRSGSLETRQAPKMKNA